MIIPIINGVFLLNHHTFKPLGLDRRVLFFPCRDQKNLELYSAVTRCAGFCWPQPLHIWTRNQFPRFAGEFSVTNKMQTSPQKKRDNTPPLLNIYWWKQRDEIDINLCSPKAELRTFNNSYLHTTKTKKLS